MMASPTVPGRVSLDVERLPASLSRVQIPAGV